MCIRDRMNPCAIKIYIILFWFTPIVLKIAISDRFSVTPITNVETMLKAATAIIKVKIINITFFSNLIAAKRLAC